MDKKKKYRHEYYLKHRDEEIAYAKKYAKENRERLAEYNKEYGKKYRSKNKDRIKELGKIWVKNNPDKKRAITKRYFDKNPHLKATYWENRRARIAGAKINNFTNNDWLEILDEYNHVCAYCGSDGPLSRDHVIPLSKGGDHTKSNIVPACKSCNSKKHNKIISKEEYEIKESV